jgi:hypothetical protein
LLIHYASPELGREDFSKLMIILNIEPISDLIFPRRFLCNFGKSMDGFNSILFSHCTAIQHWFENRRMFKVYRNVHANASIAIFTIL